MEREAGERVTGRGYFGVGIVSGKCPENLGGLWRSAHAFGADFLFTVGARYPSRRQPTDTSDARKHVPLFEFATVPELVAFVPAGTAFIGVELDNRAVPLVGYTHPERAVYLLGAEDRGLPASALGGCDDVVRIPGTHCLNVATAGSIVLYDRIAKATR